jgi:hypothetical protein
LGGDEHHQPVQRLDEFHRRGGIDVNAAAVEVRKGKPGLRVIGGRFERCVFDAIGGVGCPQGRIVKVDVQAKEAELPRQFRQTTRLGGVIDHTGHRRLIQIGADVLQSRLGHWLIRPSD